MSNRTLAIIGCSAVAILILLVVYVHGQSSMTLQSGGLLSTCTQPVAGSKALIFCNVANDPANPDGLYVSGNGAAFFRVSNSVSVAGVKTFKGRAGDVVPTFGDYKYTDLATPPTKIHCSRATLAAGTTTEGFDADTCTFTP